MAVQPKKPLPVIPPPNRPSRDIKLLHPYVAKKWLQLVAICDKMGIDIIPVQTHRSHEYQAWVYAEGRTRAGTIHSNAPAGTSYHEVDVAIDFCILDHHGAADWDSPYYDDVAKEAKKLGFEWGGDFKTIKGDFGHLQMSGGLTVKQWMEYQKGSKKYKPNFPAK